MCGRPKQIGGAGFIRGWFIRTEGQGPDIGEVYLTASQKKATQEANALLMTASPALLQALQEAVDFELSKDNPIPPPWVAMAKRAIRKATVRA